MQDMKSPESARAILVGLTVECPQGAKLETCPLLKKRQASFLERFNWVKSLADDEILDVFSAHCDCLKTKGQGKQIR